MTLKYFYIIEFKVEVNILIKQTFRLEKKKDKENKNGLSIAKFK